jgi:hypothetical protein
LDDHLLLGSFLAISFHSNLLFSFLSGALVLVAQREKTSLPFSRPWFFMRRSTRDVENLVWTVRGRGWHGSAYGGRPRGGTGGYWWMSF